MAPQPRLMRRLRSTALRALFSIRREKSALSTSLANMSGQTLLMVKRAYRSLATSSSLMSALASLSLVSVSALVSFSTFSLATSTLLYVQSKSLLASKVGRYLLHSKNADHNSIGADIWSANSTGVYGGVQSQGNGNYDDTSNLDSTFLRGIQQADDDGVVQFSTIFPGHYQGRTTHVVSRLRRNPHAFVFLLPSAYLGRIQNPVN